MAADEWPRGVDVRPSFYPHVRPLIKQPDKILCNDAVPEDEEWLSAKAAMPWPQQPAPADPVPVKPHRVWDKKIPLPFPHELSRHEGAWNEI